MEEPQQQKKAEDTLKSILNNFEKIPANVQVESTTQVTETVEVSMTEEYTQELKKLTNEYKRASNLAKRSQSSVIEIEDKLQKKLKIEKINERKLETAKNDKAILLSRIGYLNQKMINREDPNFDKKIKDLNNELREQKSKLVIRENEYNLSLIQSDRFESESKMWKGLYSKANDLLVDVVKNSGKQGEVGQGGGTDGGFLEKILVEEEAYISQLSVFEEAGDVEMAQRVFENDLKKLRKVIDNENQLQEKLKSLKETHLEKEKQMDEKYSKLLEMYQRAKDQISKSESFQVEKYMEGSHSREEVKKVIQKFMELQQRHSSLKSTVKKYAEMWTKNLKESSKKDYEVIKLTKTYEKLQKTYGNLEEEMNKKLEKEIEEKIGIRDKIIEEQGFQIQNLLYQNHKLRQFIHSKTGEYILPLDHVSFEKSSLKTGSDRKMYNTIEEQVEQITKLRKKLYVLSSRVEESLERKQRSSEQGEKSAKAGSYSHPYNSLLKRYQKSKKEILKLQKETATWKETTQKLLREKSEIQTKYRNLQNMSKGDTMTLKSKVESYENLKNDLIQKLTKATNENSNLEIDRIQSQQTLQMYKNKVDRLEKEKAELNSTINILSKGGISEDDIWQRITVVIEDPDVGNLDTDKHEVVDLLKEVREDFRSQISKVNEGVKQRILIEQYKEHCTLLENMLRECKNKQEAQIEKTREFIKSMSGSINGSNLEDLLSSISLNSDLQTFCPTLVCLKLTKKIKEYQSKYEKLRGEMLDKNTIQKEKELEVQVKELSENLENLTKSFEQEKREKQQLMQMIEGKDKGVYDAIKFRKIIEENKELKKVIDELKFNLSKEKEISQNKMLDMEQNLAKISLLSSKISKLHSLKNDLLSQLNLQKSVNTIKLKETTHKLEFFKSENDLLKIKIEKMVEGVKHLKKYMYESLTDQEKSTNKNLLDNLDTVITNISQNLIRVKNEYQTMSLIFNKNAVEKITEISVELENLTSKTMKDAETYEIGISREEAEKLRNEIQDLQTKNRVFEEKIKASERIIEKQNLGVDIGQNLVKNIDVDRLTNVLQKSLDMIMVRMSEDK